MEGERGEKITRKCRLIAYGTAISPMMIQAKALVVAQQVTGEKCRYIKMTTKKPEVSNLRHRYGNTRNGYVFPSRPNK